MSKLVYTNFRYGSNQIGVLTNTSLTLVMKCWIKKKDITLGRQGTSRTKITLRQ